MHNIDMFIAVYRPEIGILVCFREHKEKSDLYQLLSKLGQGFSQQYSKCLIVTAIQTQHFVYSGQHLYS